LNEKQWFQDENDKFLGEIKGVNDIGQLLVGKPDGKVSEYHFKEIEFLQHK